MLWNLLCFNSLFLSVSQSIFVKFSASAIFNVLIKNLVSDKLYCLWCDEYSDLSHCHATSWKWGVERNETKRKNGAIARANGFVDAFVSEEMVRKEIWRNRFVKNSRAATMWVPTIISASLLLLTTYIIKWAIIWFNISFNLPFFICYIACKPISFCFSAPHTHIYMHPCSFIISAPQAILSRRSITKNTPIFRTIAFHAYFFFHQLLIPASHGKQ